MKNLSFTLLIFLAGALMAAESAAQGGGKAYQEEVHYYRLSTPMPVSQSNVVEVKEFFWYACTHCLKFEPIFKNWLATRKSPKIKVELIPAIWNDMTNFHAKLFYTLKALGIQEKLHTPTYERNVSAKGRILKEDGARKYLKKYAGIDEKTFRLAWTAFGTRMKTRRARELTSQSELTGTPTLIIHGKYRIVSNAHLTLREMLNVADYLIERENQLLVKAREKRKNYQESQAAPPEDKS